VNHLLFLTSAALYLKRKSPSCGCSVVRLLTTHCLSLLTLSAGSARQQQRRWRHLTLFSRGVRRLSCVYIRKNCRCVVCACASRVSVGCLSQHDHRHHQRIIFPTQGGRKHTTHVVGLAPYRLPPESVARECARAFAAAGSTGPCATDPTVTEAVLQGEWAAGVAGMLVTHYGLPGKVVTCEGQGDGGGGKGGGKARR
jgi:translation initiation factor 1 (eIF-1/SUI1)